MRASMPPHSNSPSSAWRPRGRECCSTKQRFCLATPSRSTGDDTFFMTERSRWYAYFSLLSSSPANYVNPAVLGRDPQPRNIVLPDFRVYRDAGNWRLDTDDGKVAAESITRLVDAWRYARATAVRPYQPSLDWNDVIRVELADGDLRFDLARTEYELVLGRPDLGIQYHLTKGTGARLLSIAPSNGTP